MSAEVTDNLNVATSSAAPPTEPPLNIHQHIPHPPTAGEEMVNKPTMVKAFGREYAIKRFSMAQVFSSVEYVAPFGFILENIFALPTDERGIPILTREQKSQFVVTALSISGPSCLGLISVATGEPIEWLETEDKNPIDGLKILSEVLAKNLDFFTRDNIETVMGLIANLTSAVAAFSGKTSLT